MSVHVLMPKGREIESRDSIYFWYLRRDGDVQVARVYEHSARASKRPATWHGPFASALDAAHAAVDERRGGKRATPADPDVIDMAVNLAHADTPADAKANIAESLAQRGYTYADGTRELADGEYAGIDVIERVERAMASDYDNRDKQNDYLVGAWQRATPNERAVVDEIFIALCGWALSTILAGTDHNEDDEEEG